MPTFCYTVHVTLSRPHRGRIRLRRAVAACNQLRAIAEVRRQLFDEGFPPALEYAVAPTRRVAVCPLLVVQAADRSVDAADHRHGWGIHDGPSPDAYEPLAWSADDHDETYRRHAYLCN